LRAHKISTGSSRSGAEDQNVTFLSINTQTEA
jgi:hypothetical protein